MTGVWLIAVLLLAAAVLILLEILTPAFGALGLLALVSLAGAAYAAFVQYGNFAGFAVVVGAVVLTPAYCLFLVRKLPQWGVGKGLFLGKPAARDDDGPPNDGASASWLAGLVGKSGEAVTPLRPIGTIRVDGRRYQATADEGFIASGARIKVVRYDGMEIVVRSEPRP